MQNDSESEAIANEQQGIFGADCGGLCPDVRSNMDKVTAVPIQEGVAFQLSCPRCHMAKQIVVEYPELLAVRWGISPHIAFSGSNVISSPTEWSFDAQRNAWYPNVICTTSTCGQPIPILITMQEAEKYVQIATQRGWMPNRAQLDQRLQQVRAQYNGGR